MRVVAKAFFSDFHIWVYTALLLLTFVIVGSLRLLETHWFYLFFPLPILPFFEWVAHKYLLHAKVDPLASPNLYKYMLRLHYNHHKDPKEISYIFAPLSSAIFVFVVFYALFSLLLWSFTYALVPLVSVLGLFLFYEWTHLCHHIPQYRPLTSVGKKLKLAHSWHHYHNSNYWWGITTPIADKLLKTFPNASEVEKNSSQDISK